MSRSVIDFTQSRKSVKNAVSISLIVPRNDHLNDKAPEINRQLIDMYSEHNSPFVDQTVTIYI